MKISLQRRHAPMVENGAFSQKIDLIAIFFKDTKSRRTSILHKYFKSYCIFSEEEKKIPIGQSDEASQWRVCYQRGIPRLVYSKICFSVASFLLAASWPILNF